MEKDNNQTLKTKIIGILKSNKKIIKIAKYLIALFLIGTIAFSIYVYVINRATNINQNDVIVNVKRGMSVKSVAAILHKKKLIRSKFYFYLAARLKGAARRFKPGYYKLNYRMSSNDIIKKIAGGFVERIKVVIPEGFTNLQIAYRLESKKLCKKEEFLKMTSNSAILRRHGINATNAEGYLFPATYMFPYGADAKTIVSLMLKNFKNVINKIGSPKNGLNYYSSIILASLVEAETNRPDERKRVASVFINRIKKRRFLQSCASVKYIKMPKILELRKNLQKLKEQANLEENVAKKRILERRIKKLTRQATIITYRDLKIVNPYNTYLNMGLPPGPICNPGLKSLQAAFKPANTNFLFFVWNKRKGRHDFTTNYRSHVNRIYQIRGSLGQGN